VRLEELDFDCPAERIAQHPLEPRDSCRLMFLPAGGAARHLVFSDLGTILRPGDTLVFNDSRVLPARVEARKVSGGAVELLFLRRSETGDEDGAECWEVLARPSHRLRPGGELTLGDGERLTLVRLLGEGRWLVAGTSERSMVSIMEANGRLPIPPYIKTYPSDPSSYQTVYAAVPGSSAAPTAGLHFTPGLMDRLAAMDIKSAYVTLHVGLDTFVPIREKVVEDHRIHTETWSVGLQAMRTILEAVTGGTRLVAVGTTAARVLETLAGAGGATRPPLGEQAGGTTNIFITPGYRFRMVDALLTNFHLPKSTVLALAMAFAGMERIRRAYAEAIALDYRFFSFGDAMLIEPGVPGAGQGGDAGDMGDADAQF
jgi:S-adenosylmethionine:tRNA ribosyltransferase-isomerase